MTLADSLPSRPDPNSPQSRTRLLERIGLPLPRRAGYRTLYGGEPWFQLGDTLLRQQRPEAALAAFETAGRLEPGNTTYAHAAATVLCALKRPRAALDLLARWPASPDFLALRANLHLDLGEAQQALSLCDSARQALPHHYAAGLNRGAALRALRRLGDALDNDCALAAAHPDAPLAHYNHGDALLAAGEFSPALTALERSLALEPRFAPAMMARGLALAMLRRFAEADASFADARLTDPASAAAYLNNAAAAAGLPAATRLPEDARSIHLAWVMQAQQDCDWRQRAGLESLLPKIFAGVEDAPYCSPGMAFAMLLLDLPPATPRAAAAQVARQAEDDAARWNVCTSSDAARKDAVRRRGRLRLGFISPDFRQHPVAENHWRQFALHDRSRFEVFAYSLHPEAGSQSRQRIAAASDHFAELAQLPSEAIAQRIAADQIDILVDLSGYTEHTRPEILAARPAALQVQHMGTPGTSGADFIDYRITDPITTPPSTADAWPERLVWLPHTLWLGDDTLTSAPAPARADCGLPDDAFVFCCFNAPQKLEPASFSIWMRLLGQLPGSVLWLIEGSTTSRRHLTAEAERRGIAATRLVFAPRLPLPEHLARHACADLFLDTFNYNAHTTAYHALGAGLPLLTCAGRTMAGRLGASLVHAAGLPEMVTADPAEYAARAQQLAHHPAELAALRARLLAGRSEAPLFQTERRVRQLESAFATLWQRWEAGLPAASFEVAP